MYLKILATILAVIYTGISAFFILWALSILMPYFDFKAITIQLDTYIAIFALLSFTGSK